MKIVEFAFVVYPAKELARSRAFYEGVLGLTSGSLSDESDGFWLEYEIGPHTLAIGNRPFMKPSGDGPSLVLEVDDFDGAVEHLRRNKVQFALEPFDAPECRGAIILDPDGNKLGIHKRKAEPSSRANGHQRLGHDAFGFMNISRHSLSARSVAVAHSGR